MAEKDPFYEHLLHRCQSPVVRQRLDALKELSGSEYLEHIPAQFLLDRLNSTSIAEEQSSLLDVMSRLPSPLPIEALLAILADRETSPLHLRQAVVHTLAAVQAKASIALLLRLLQDPSEDLELRWVIAEDLECFGQDMPFDALLTAVADPDVAISAAAMLAMRTQPALIPIDLVLSYRTHPEAYIREVVMKTLMATGQRVPIEPIISALSDPVDFVRVVASEGCVRLLEWFGERIPLEPLLKALEDDSAAVRENILDVLGNYPERVPLEAIINALDDPVLCYLTTERHFCFIVQP